MNNSLTFQLDGNTGQLVIMRHGIIIAQLSPDDQLELLMHVAHAHMTRNQHLQQQQQTRLVDPSAQ